MDNIKLAQQRVSETIALKTRVLESLPKEVAAATGQIVARLKKGGRIFTCGNGGSCCDAQHIAGELVVRFYKNRAAIPAIALETNPGVMTAISNDFTFDEAFSRSASALMGENDVLIALSTSGNSPNVLRAIDVAKEKGTWVLGMSGETGGKMADVCDQILLVPSSDTPRIQEVHITFAHILCELIENEMFS